MILLPLQIQHSLTEGKPKSALVRRRVPNSNCNHFRCGACIPLSNRDERGDTYVPYCCCCCFIFANRQCLLKFNEANTVRNCHAHGCGLVRGKGRAIMLPTSSLPCRARRKEGCGVHYTHTHTLRDKRTRKDHRYRWRPQKGQQKHPGR